MTLLNPSTVTGTQPPPPPQQQHNRESGDAPCYLPPCFASAPLDHAAQGSQGGAHPLPAARTAALIKAGEGRAAGPREVNSPQVMHCRDGRPLWSTAQEAALRGGRHGVSAAWAPPPPKETSRKHFQRTRLSPPIARRCPVSLPCALPHADKMGGKPQLFANAACRLQLWIGPRP